MHVRVLGPLEVVGPDGAHPPRGERGRSLLAVLVQRRGRVVPADLLLDAVWGDAAAGLTVSAVHTVVARLRRQFGPGLIETRADGYLLPDSVTTDADTFLESCRLARAAGAAARTDERIAAYRRAVGSWFGATAYEGVSDDLVLAERARLDEARRQASEGWADALLDGGGHLATEEALGVAGELRRESPLREGAYRTAMLAAYRLGRPAEAIAIHDDLRRELRRELGVDPSRATQDLFLRILRQDPELDPRGGPVVRDAPPRVYAARTLPLPSTPTVAREDEVAAVLGALSDGHRLVTITGPGGVGKSRLLCEVGLALGDTETAFVDLSAQEGLTEAELARTMADAHCIIVDGPDPVLGLARGLATQAVIVLVDEAEWVLDAVAGVLRVLLDRCPELRFVITSRHPIRLVGEALLTLQPLTTPTEGDSPEQIRQTAAVRLLLDRLADSSLDLPGSAVPWTDEDFEALAALTRSVDGLPLALELVAAACSGLSSGSLAPTLADLRRAPLDIASEDRDRPARHHSLRETVRWSVDRLTDGERTALRRLSVIVGGFDLATARAIVGPLPRGADLTVILRRLARDGLLSVDRRAHHLRLVMLRTVRDLAAEELADAGEAEVTRGRHRSWFAARWRGLPLGDDLVEELGSAQDDVFDALRGAVAAAEGETAGDLLLALHRRWQFLEASAQGLEWSDRVLTLPGLTERQRAQLRVVRAGFARAMDWSPEEGLQIRAELTGDPDWLGLLLLMEGIHAYVCGDLDSALDRSHDFLAVARRGATHHEPEALATLAAVHGARGESEPAMAFARESLALIGTVPSAVHFVTVIPKVALAMTDAGAAADALAMLAVACDGVQKRFGMGPTPTMSTNAGWAALDVGDHRAALAWFVRALRGPTAYGTPVERAEPLMGAMSALVGLGADDASDLFVCASSLLERVDVALTPAQRSCVDREAPRVSVGAVGAPDWDLDLLAEHLRREVLRHDEALPA